MFLQLPVVPDATAKNLADSLKVTQEAAMTMLKEDPRHFVELIIEDLIQFGIKLLAALLLFSLGLWIIRRIKSGISKRFERRGTDKTISSFTMSFLSFMLYVILLLVCIGTLGVNTTSLAALLAAGGMAIGMALSGTVQNFAGGIMLLVFKPFKVGDYIEAQGFGGTVSDISIVSTKITTPDNRVVVIPNGALSNGNINNFSTGELRRVDLKFSVEYGSDADACIECIRTLLSGDKRILDSSVPGAADPFVALLSLNDNDITFVVRVWVKNENYWDVYFDTNKTLYTELPRHGYGFAYPHMDVRLTDRN